MISELPAAFEHYEFTRLSQDNAPALQQLLERCGDYYNLVEGRPAGPLAAVEEITDRPAELASEDMFCIGVQNGLILVAVLTAFRNFKQPRQWYITFLLLDPAWRSQGLGHKIYAAFEHWITAQGANSILLAVVGANSKAKSFWASVGFTNRHEYEGVSIGLYSHTLIELEKRLSPEPNEDKEFLPGA